MNRSKSRIEIALATVLTAVFTMPALAQFIGNSPGHSLQKGPPVRFVYPEQVHVTAGKPAEVVLHFRVTEGMHVNSHTPREDFLIPTTFSIPTGEGVRLESASYPAGSDISLPSAPKMKINVYSDEFTVETRMVAAPGNHLVRGVLHFQACNETQCLPPQTITAAVDVVAK
ncbi:MAG TPA: protein-disulfide reductase DsbD domain-containing protein [Bryobacteraceae bacterium]|nr:protein-disulfide reductase DsbD domain-containing protein [Bryobacteraceae bacterium]